MPDPGPRPLPYWPAAMREERAAAYLDVSPGWFRQNVAPVVGAIRVTDRVVLYRRQDLDRWLDARAGAVPASEEPNPWHA